MATPHVVAAAALAWSANPQLTNRAVRQILRDTALDLGARGWHAAGGPACGRGFSAGLQTVKIKARGDRT